MNTSVIMAAHNSAAYIEEAIASVVAQTVQDWELIVVDDGSTDDTSAIVERMASVDPRIRLMRHAKAKGPAAARNTALGEACGKWITILDSDDTFAPNRLERMVADAESRDLDFLADNLAVTHFETHEDLGTAFPIAWMSQGQLLNLRSLLDGNCPEREGSLPIGLVQPLMRRAFLENANLRYDETKRCAEDLLLVGEALIFGARFGLMPDPLYRYRMWRRSSMSHQRICFDCVCSINDRFLSLIGETDPELSDFLLSRGYDLQYNLFRASWTAGEFLAAAKSLRRMPAAYVVQRVYQGAKWRLKGEPRPATNWASR